MENRVMLADSYKYSQPFQYENGMTFMHGYLESRGGKYPATIFIGLQMIMKKYFSSPITEDEVYEAAEYAKLHGEPFDLKGWLYIVQELGGKLPIEIRAVEEGTLIPVKNVQMVITSTDVRVPWIAGWMETFLLKLWYSINIATKSFYIKKTLTEFGKKYADSNWNPDFAYHNFGDRGSTCVEAAAIGGVAHLSCFMGTDNFNSLRYANHFYGDSTFKGYHLPIYVYGYSIPASEHSTITSWGREKELNMIMNYLERSKGSPMIACVMDSYNIYDAVDAITQGEFKSKIESNEYPIFVIRPDSGDIETVIEKLIHIMEYNGVKYTHNDKGLMVWNKYRMIWGDGIDEESIVKILEVFIRNGYGIENISFGSGGNLIQQHDRDTNKYAIKCSYVKIKGEGRDVFKDPITDQGKVSKKGELALVYKDGEYNTVTTQEAEVMNLSDLLVPVYRDGEFLTNTTLEDIRRKVNEN
jgi:nicotinamide phosphoribosyltransferase